MVITHDCQMDKEAEAKAEAENHSELDRFVTVVPIVPVSWLRTDDDRLRSGEVTGYYPVLAWPERGIAGGVADLTFPSTIDRKLLIHRMASLTDQTRGRLRLSLTRLYAFRSPEVGFEVEAAVGHRILGVRRVLGSALEIILTLQGGGEVRLVLKPEEPKKGRAARPAPR